MTVGVPRRPWHSLSLSVCAVFQMTKIESSPARSLDVVENEAEVCMLFFS